MPALWGARGDRKDKKTKQNNQQKSTSLDLMSPSYETNPPLVPSTVRGLFIRTNIDNAVTNTWGFSNQCSFFLNRPDLLPKYDPVTKFKHWQMQHEKSLNSPCLYVCGNLWFDFLSARRWIQQRLADMIDLSTRLACVNCLLDWLIVRPSATAQTWFTAGVLRHEAWLSISCPQRLYQLISY